MADWFNPLAVTDPADLNRGGNPLYSVPTPADAWTFNRDAAQDWIEQQRAISRERGLWNDTTGLPTQAGVVDAAQQYGSGVLMGTTAPGMRGGFTAPIRPASESVPRAMDATFVHGKDLGPKMMPIGKLSGGVSTTDLEAARVASLKEQMSGENGYISRLIVDSDGNVIEGQHRLEALRQLGAKNVPVHVVHDMAAGVDTKGLQGSIRSAQQMHPDQSKQLIDHVLDAVHGEKGSVAAVRAGYEPPAGYGAAWNAALDFLDKPAAAPGIRAFHGSPHSFERFSADKIGTGEGAQAYGHGLYFAGNEGVARSYRDNLSGNLTPAQNKAYTAASGRHADATKEYSDLQNLVTYHSIERGQPLDPQWGELGVEPHPEVAKLFQPKLDRAAAQRDAAKAEMDALLGAPRDPGHMYEVNINANPEHFLDWDKPLSEQSKHVQEALKPIIAEVAKTGRAASGLGYADLSKLDNPTGAQLQGLLGVYADKNAAVLHQAGIPGIRYLDGGSRASGEGTSNHVVFDAGTIEILRKYGLAGLMAGAGGVAAASQAEAAPTPPPAPAPSWHDRWNEVLTRRGFKTIPKP